jgi:CTP-dependent riboflavin kinase
MSFLMGRVKSGAGGASRSLAWAETKIAKAAGFPRVVRGTLDLDLCQVHVLAPGAMIPPEGGPGTPFLLLEACTVRGIPGCIAVPTLEPAAPHEVHMLGIVSYRHLRSGLGLRDGDVVEVETGIDPVRRQAILQRAVSEVPSRRGEREGSGRD